MKEWAMVLGTMIVSVAVLVFGRGAYEGESMVEVTIVPSDAVNLGCEGLVGAHSCAAPSPLRPFVTTAGRLVALPGLFQERAVSEWLRHPRSENERVRVWCHARRVATGASLAIRFSANDELGMRSVDVAEISGCEIR